MKKISESEKERYSKFISLPEMGEEGQLKLKNSKILVIGAGGLGSAVLPVLAAAGIGTMGVVEHDTVELSNLQRQIIYTPADVGKKKLNIACEYLQKINPELEIISFDTRFEEKNAEELIRKFDLVLDCTDNYKTRYLINDTCSKLKKSLIYASVNDYEGQVVVLHHKQNTNLRDLYPEIPDDHENNRILPTLPQIIGSIQANETIKVLTNRGNILDGQLLIFNIYANSFQIVNI